MKKASGYVLLFVVLGWTGLCSAGDLAFPKTESQIVQALKIKDGKTTFNGVEYVSEAGNVYRVINGKRFQMRGLDSIVDSDITPKAGALIHFDYDSANIKLESYPLLDEYGKALMGGLSTAVLAVAGHTDSKGPDDYNMSLSEKRANAVKEYLVSNHKIGADRLRIKAYGKSKQIASNDSPEGRAFNRRVEFIRTGEL
ncbi:MAG: OmpA family protein [Syntrophobacteraceae bacterium]